MQKFRIFVVDDDAWYSEMLEYFLAMNPDNELFRYTNAKDCLANLHRKPDLVTLDYNLPDGNGAAVLEKIKQVDASVPVIIISAQEDISTAIGLLKAGAYDYFTKDEHTKDLLWNAVIRIGENRSLKNEVAQLREELGQKYDLGKLIKGNSPAIAQVFSLIEKASRTNINVSITGETGTGKELVAKAIHYNSERSKKPLVAVNMAAIPADLIESELFGHEKGAFTGAVARKTGKFEEAHKGTLFLDEIAELDLGLQSKLLRVIQEREVVRIGGHERIPLDVRIITATHLNLSEAVRKGAFREDLYYRIIGMPVNLPPLRERGGDVLLLAKFFLGEFCKQNKLPAIQIEADAREKLMSYAYPGNIRELKAIVELGAVMCNDGRLYAADITFNPAVSSRGDFTLQEKSLHAYMVDIITAFLRKYDNNVLKVAEKLDVGKSTIYKMLKEKEIIL